MKARYFRIRFGSDIGNLSYLLREVYLFDENYNDITANATKTHISALTTSSYSMSYAHDRDAGTYTYAQSYHEYDFMSTVGFANAFKYDFGGIVDIRRITFNWRSKSMFVFECSNDNNLWVMCAHFANVDLGTIDGYPDFGQVPADTYEVPAHFQIQPHLFWGIKIKTHTPNATTDVKIRNLVFRDKNDVDVSNLMTGWNSMIMSPRNWSNPNTFVRDGAYSLISDINNTVGQPILNTQRIGSTYWGQVMDPYTGLYLEHNDYYGYVLYAMPGLYWNNTNQTSSLANALMPATKFDRIMLMFDNLAPNQPKCVTISFGDYVSTSRWEQNSYINPAYHPMQMVDMIFIDDYTPYITSGLDIKGLDSVNLLINNVLFTPDTVPPTTTCSVDSGYYTTPQHVTLSIDEPGTTYYSVNGGPQQIYNNPLDFNNDLTLQFHSVDIYSNVEVTQQRVYVIDLNPLVISLSPRPGTFRMVKLLFRTNKAGQVFYSLNNGPYIEYSAAVVISDKLLISVLKRDFSNPCPIVYSIDNAEWVYYTEIFEAPVGSNVRIALRDEDNNLVGLKEFQY